MSLSKDRKNPAAKVAQDMREKSAIGVDEEGTIVHVVGEVGGEEWAGVGEGRENGGEATFADLEGDWVVG